MGKVPALQDGEIRVFESGAIVEYLIERYGGQFQKLNRYLERLVARPSLLKAIAS